MGHTCYDTDEEEARGIAARIARLVAGCVDARRLRGADAHQRAAARDLRRASGRGIAIPGERDSGWQNSALADDAWMPGNRAGNRCALTLPAGELGRDGDFPFRPIQTDPAAHRRALRSFFLE